MYAGAAVWTVLLISALVLIILDSKAVHATVGGHTLHGRSVPITVAAVFGLIVIALWLWMARANDQGRNWALDDSRPDAAEGPQDGDEDGQLKQRAQLPAGAESVRGDLTRFSNLRN
jgi:hypothetical protein